MRYLVVIICVFISIQSFGRGPLSTSGAHGDFRAIIEAFCHNHSILGNTLLVLESGRLVISLAERLPAARIADLVANKVGLETDDRGLVISAISGDEPYYNQFEISGGRVQVHPQRYFGNDFLVGLTNNQLSFGGVIRKKRIELQQQFGRKSFSMGAVSDLLGISRATLHSWETGRGFPNKQRLQKLARLLSLEIDVLQQLRAKGKEQSLAQETIDYLERQVRDEKITLDEIETLGQFKEYLKSGIDGDANLPEHRLGANIGTKFKLYYTGEAIPKRQTVAKLAKIVDVEYDLLWKALIRDKLADKFVQYNLIEYRHRFTRPAIYESFKKLSVAKEKSSPPASQEQSLDVDKEMENFEVTTIDIISYDQPFSALLSEHLADHLIDASFEMFVYRSGISEEKLTNFVNGLSLPNKSELETIASELLIEVDELYWSVQIEKFLDLCLKHLQNDEQLVSVDSVLPEAIKEALEFRRKFVSDL